jgi:hypothetical protein
MRDSERSRQRGGFPGEFAERRRLALHALSARPKAFGAALASALFLLLIVPGQARADTLVIKRPGAHPDYAFEAEPHLLLGFVDPPGPAGGNGFGLGFRGTVEIVDNGFVPSINNTVGIGFGLDWVRYSHGGRSCGRPGREGCEFFDDEKDVDYLIVPVVLQWNFWLSRKWSVFGEPGVALRFFDGDADFGDDDDGFDFDPFVFYAGGRWHFSEYLSLTMRVGYPTFSVGVSMLF